MKIHRVAEPSKFEPFSIVIQIEDSNDASLLLNLLNKLDPEVKSGGIYYNIIRNLRAALHA